MRNKRGALSIEFIIVVIMGAIILVFFAFWFITGSFPFKTLVENLVGGKSNVDIVSQSCKTACVTQSTYDFCSKKRELRAEDETLKGVTCFWLSEKKTGYGIESCAEITCDVVFAQTECALGKTLQTFNEATKALNHTICKAS